MTRDFASAENRVWNSILESYQPDPIAGDFTGKHIVTVDQFAREDLAQLFEATMRLEQRIRNRDRGIGEVAHGAITAQLFFEASTRTDLSFQSAVSRLGGRSIGASNGIEFSSVHKGEDLPDTVRAAGCYADVIILRHNVEGASLIAAYFLDILRKQIQRQPVVISAGDGTGEHPTQALLDAYTIFKRKGGLGGLRISMVGDLRFGRTVHSLVKLLCLYTGEDIQINLVSPEVLRLPEPLREQASDSGLTVKETGHLREVLFDSDVIYWTRIQEERFDSRDDYDEVKDEYVMLPELLSQTPINTVLMHPLPRKHEMGTASDKLNLDLDQRSIYFQQMENGMFIRMSLIALVLGRWV